VEQVGRTQMTVFLHQFQRRTVSPESKKDIGDNEYKTMRRYMVLY